MRSLTTHKQFKTWHKAGEGGGFMGLSLRDMTKEELFAVIGYFLLHEKRVRERERYPCLTARQIRYLSPVSPEAVKTFDYELYAEEGVILEWRKDCGCKACSKTGEYHLGPSYLSAPLQVGDRVDLWSGFTGVVAMVGSCKVKIDIGEGYHIWVRPDRLTRVEE